ncbi:hypothetical protein SBV1_30058 [Verrucomicrobia bacterium]|nr:hypothetical protein SBV1_30058 [Verrucomicrobiota bacterium]
MQDALTLAVHWHPGVSIEELANGAYDASTFDGPLAARGSQKPA